MPISELTAPGVPDEKAVAIALSISPSPEDYLKFIQQNVEFAQFVWRCFYELMDSVGYVPQPLPGEPAKTITCYVPLGYERDPVLSEQAVETLIGALRTVRWVADVTRNAKTKQLALRLKGVLSADDVLPENIVRRILPNPLQFSHLMRPDNEALARLVWSIGHNILHKKRTLALGSSPQIWLTGQVLTKGAYVYKARGWDIQPWSMDKGFRKTTGLNIMMPPRKALPAPGNTL